MLHEEEHAGTSANVFLDVDLFSFRMVMRTRSRTLRNGAVDIELRCVAVGPSGRSKILCNS